MVWIGSEHPVPHIRAHPKATTRSRVMVFQMVVLEKLCYPIMHREVMRGVVDIVVDQVSNDKTAAKYFNPGHWYEQPK